MYDLYIIAPTYLLLNLYAWCYFLIEDRKKWDTFTRFISSCNALQCSIMVYRVIRNNLDLSSLYFKPEEYYTNSLFWFAAYLFVDGLFQLPDLYSYFSFSLLLSILHHVVGGFGIYLIAEARMGFFLGFYFAMTEVSTPLLNLSWYYRYKFLFTSFYMVFFLCRIVTIPFLLNYLYQNAEYITTLGTLRSSMCFYASYTLIVLNLIWFIFLTKKVLSFEN